MQPYIEIDAYHIGKSHIQNGLACEDYSAAYSDESVSIAVISDGHGDKNCFRSAGGARYACEISVNLCRQFQSITNHIDDISHCNFEDLVTSLESEIAERWKTKVLSDAQIHPFTAEELSQASEQAQAAYRAGSGIEKAYGCTLIAAMVSAQYWLAIQIGDGKCVAAYQDGAFVEPIPIDENCLGNRSTSLCNSNSKESFRHYYSAIKPAAVFVSSDGVEESFDTAGLYNCFYSVAYWLKADGYEAAKRKLEDLLPQISEGGSGDDVSLAAMVSSADSIAKPRQTLDQVYEKVDACAGVLEQYNTKLESQKDKLLENLQELETLEKQIADIKKMLDKATSAYDQIFKERKQLEEKIADCSAKVRQASVQMEKAHKFKETAEQYWFSKFENLGLKNQAAPEEFHEDDKEDPPMRPIDESDVSENNRDDSEEAIKPAIKSPSVSLVKHPIPAVKKADDTHGHIADSATVAAYEFEELMPGDDSTAHLDKSKKTFWPFGKLKK
ncbi:MAG: protein phosphatase 2C domain-containing protein [Clostridium sp.]|nr:protein phosphatase 2C domain-containing protein [Clostridium sp.]